jgi:hypothetical protein
MVMTDNHTHLTGFWHMLAFFGLSECPCNCTSDLKELVYQRLWNILNGDDSTADFQKIPVETNTAVREILAQTRRDLPAYWNKRSPRF